MTAADGVGLLSEQVPDNRVLPEENGAVELADQQPATKGASPPRAYQDPSTTQPTRSAGAP